MDDTHKTCIQTEDPFERFKELTHGSGAVRDTPKVCPELQSSDRGPDPIPTPRPRSSLVSCHHKLVLHVLAFIA